MFTALLLVSWEGTCTYTLLGLPCAWFALTGMAGTALRPQRQRQVHSGYRHVVICGIRTMCPTHACVYLKPAVHYCWESGSWEYLHSVYHHTGGGNNDNAHTAYRLPPALIAAP